MPSSPKTPKHTLGLPARYPSKGRRCHSQRRILFLFSLVLFVSSGSLLILHITTSSFSRSSDSLSCSASSSRGECAPAPRRQRWRPDYDEDNSKGSANGYYDPEPQEQNNSPFRAHDRGRNALPHPPAENNVVENQDPSGLRIPASGPKQIQDQNVVAPSTTEQDETTRASSEKNEQSSDGTLTETSKNSEENLSENKENMEQAPVVDHYPSFAESLDPEDSTKYLTYLPYAGITNQFYGILRGVEVARATGRTLIIPPITASSHDKSKQNQPWSKFLDLERFSKLANVKVVEFHKLRNAEQTEIHELKCGITCGFGSKRTIDFTAKGFLKQWKMNVTLEALPKDAGDLKTISSMLNTRSEEKYLCISNTYKILVEDRSEWERFGQHLHFTEELEEFTREFLDRQLKRPEPVLDPKTKTVVSPPHEYLAIHVRRGDFVPYCQTNFKGPKLIHCLPSTEQVAERIDAVQTRLKAERGTPDMLPLPVFVATNEKEPEELKKFAELGWLTLDHSTMGTAEALGVFGPMMVDQVLMAHAQALVGIQMSTFSRVGALRQRDWHKHPIEYM
ncbi:peptide-O-fucosyltransferase [Entomortierella parvispora]|uniref:GDP-fucose protein O-fucosyltransferase 2 n=1 Tax=Entomortierella parvispora TaxID=205924 RepID=A0A9P3M0Y4_9FUNG|nr:peptide-O-fucosyltransferase [Entomortierella parvispora]